MSSALVNQQQEFGTRLNAQYGEACVFLIAEDNPADEALVCEMLYQAFGDHCRVECVDCYQKTLDMLDQGDFSALILDICGFATIACPRNSGPAQDCRSATGGCAPGGHEGCRH